jgi:hypothetical protein
MAKIKIVVSVIDPIPAPPTGPDPTTPGDQVTFTEDVVVKQYKRKKPGHGLPKKDEDRLAGTHSGLLTLLRIAKPGDRFFPPDTFVFQYVATYKFNKLAKTPLKKSQITGQGIVLFDPTTNTRLEVPNRFAITGGTDAYDKARGEIIELHNATEDREIHIEL